MLYSVLSQFSFVNTAYDDEFNTEAFKLELKKKELGGLKRLRGSWLDYYWKAYILVALWYYAMDNWYLATTYNLWTDGGYCYLGMFLHHLATLHGILPALMLPYYPWFFSFIFSFHCYLIVWPYNKLLHVPYTAGLLFFLYKLFTKPFFQMKYFRLIITCLPMLTVGLLTFAFNGCDCNDLRY